MRMTLSLREVSWELSMEKNWGGACVPFIVLDVLDIYRIGCWTRMCCFARCLV